MKTGIKLTFTNPSQVQIGNVRNWYKQQGIRNIRRMFNAMPPDNTANAISDTMTLNFHIAILKIESETMRNVN
jgi:hypothetical protein